MITTSGTTMKRPLLLGALLLAPFTAAASCGSAFCTVNTSWDVHGAWLEPGARLDLRYEYIDQSQPMSGSRKIGVGEIRRHHDEVYTKNRNYIEAIDYTFNADCGVNVLMPLVEREHLHIHSHGGAQLEERWDFRELGVMCIMGRRLLAPLEAGQPLASTAIL